MRWIRFALVLFVLCTPVLARIPEWCEGEVACCIFDRCEDCDCHLCVIAGGQPAGPNSTCRDECVCFDDPPPPLCNNNTFCRVAYSRCIGIPECGRCLNETEQDFCSNINRLAALHGLQAEEICATPELLTFFLLLYSSLVCPPKPPSQSIPPPCPSPPPLLTLACPEPPPCPPVDDRSTENLLMALLLFMAVLLVLVCCFSPFFRRRHRHSTHMHYVDDGGPNTPQMFQYQK